MKRDCIKVKYIYSACIVTTTPDISILHDPWFTEGIYDGSWYQFPLIKNPFESIGNVDCIYISHIHPDHYDSSFLKKYFQRFGVKKIYIANHNPNHLLAKMRIDGFNPSVLCEKEIIGDTSIEILPHKTDSISDIDSAIIVKYKSQFSEKLHCIVNANDMIFDEVTRNQLKMVCGDVDILLCGYTGAGSYPQTYFDVTAPELPHEASKKKNAFFTRYLNLIKVINAKVNIPFAGKYILGGNLTYLNDFRGVSDPVEVLALDKNAVVLADNGGEIDTKTLIPTKFRDQQYNVSEIKKRLLEVNSIKMNYEKLIVESEVSQLPIKRLLIQAAKNAHKKSECFKDYFFCINIPGEEYAIINANKESSCSVFFTKNSSEIPEPNSKIIIDPRYLFGLLTHVYHWNNAEIGSQYQTRRTPNILLKEAQSFLNYLSV